VGFVGFHVSLANSDSYHGISWNSCRSNRRASRGKLCAATSLVFQHPQFRYQTSQASKEMVEMKLHDVTGSVYFNKMKELAQKHYVEK
jgi:pectin methylesterase-like acyl-CoA thioesterase